MEAWMFPSHCRMLKNWKEESRRLEGEAETERMPMP